MLPDQPHSRPDDRSGDLDDNLPIDLMNDSFLLEGMGRIMAEARACRAGSHPAAGRAS